MVNEKISVIVPVYNTAPYLDRCIQSILEQTYANKELILVNDGSKDDSLKICESWAHKYDCIKVLNQDNQGVTAARRNGLELASGTLIAFVDSDDELPNNSLETLADKMEKSDIVIGNVFFKGSWKWPYKKRNILLDGKGYLKMLFKGCFHGGPVARLFRRHLFNEKTLDIPRKIACGEDYIMNVRLALQASSVRVIPDDVYIYDYRDDSSLSLVPSNISSFRRLGEYEKSLYASFDRKLSCSEKIMWLKYVVRRRKSCLRFKLKGIVKKIIRCQ